MNLVDDPWIPVIYTDKSNKLVSLNTLFNDAEIISDLAATPPQRISLMRLLICITQAALDGPEDEEKWYYCKPEIMKSSLNYLDKWKNRFELFGDHGFLQANTININLNATCDKLDFGLAAGNNPVLFDHNAKPDGRSWPASWLALMLLTYQCFSPGGLIGVAKWNEKNTSKTSEHAPAIVESAMHTIIIGENICETLHKNLLTKEQISSIPNTEWGFPIWCAGDELNNEAINEQLVFSYLGRLVPLSRAIKLYDGQLMMTLANGLSYPKLPEGREPAATVLIKKRASGEEEGYLGIDVNKHAWRQLGSLLTIKKDSLCGGALVLHHLQHIEKSSAFDIWTGGMAADKGKVLDFAEWHFSLPASIINDRELQIYEKGVDLAQTAQYILGIAISAYCAEMKMENILGEKGRKIFWPILNERHTMLIECAAIKGDISGNWYDTVNTAMKEAYSFACPHITPRQIQAFAKGERRLWLNKPET